MDLVCSQQKFIRNHYEMLLFTTNNNGSKRSFKQVKLKQSHIEMGVRFQLSFSLFRLIWNYELRDIQSKSTQPFYAKNRIILIGFDRNDIFVFFDIVDIF